MFTQELWECQSCYWKGVLPEREDEDDFSCPLCYSIITAFVELQEIRGVG